MSKVMIVNLKVSNYSNKNLVMSWEKYVEFAKKTQGEGIYWKAVLC